MSVAETLEQSAQLAEKHAERQRTKGRSDATEVARAEQARVAASRARQAADEYQ